MGSKLYKKKFPRILRTLGIDKVDHNLFCSIKNNKYCVGNKPLGGLWTSPVGSEYGWKEFVIGEDFRTEKYLKKECLIRLKSSVKLFIIDGIKDLDKCPTVKNNLIYYNNRTIDWEELSKSYDGVWLTLNGERDTRYSSYNKSSLGDLYGWDVETVLLFNLNCIKNVTKRKIREN